MKNSISRLALLAIVGSVVCSAVLAGCGGGNNEDTNSTNNATPTKNAAKEDTP